MTDFVGEEQTKCHAGTEQLREPGLVKRVSKRLSQVLGLVNPAENTPALETVSETAVSVQAAEAEIAADAFVVCEDRRRSSQQAASNAKFAFSLEQKEQDLVDKVRGELAGLPGNPETKYAKEMRTWELVRFLRGHNNDIKETKDFVVKTSAWRSETDVGAIVQSYTRAKEDLSADMTSPRFLKAYYPSRRLGETSGRQVSLYRMACVDFVQLQKQSSLEALCNFMIAQLETGWQAYPGGQGILIFDLGYNDDEKNRVLNSLWDVQPFIASLLSVLEHIGGTVDPAYPESFSSIYMIRPPSIFKGIWKVAQYFVAERTRQKVKVLGSTPKTWAPLYESVPRELLPEWMGGSNLEPFPKGGKLKKA